MKSHSAPQSSAVTQRLARKAANRARYQRRYARHQPRITARKIPSRRYSIGKPFSLEALRAAAWGVR